VHQETQLSGRYPVNTDGAFTFPMLGRVQVAGLTPRAIEDRLAGLLADGYLKNPQVTVEVESYRSQTVTVTGEVRTPGKIPLTGQMTLLDVIVQAGSLTPTAGSELQITRQRPSSGGQAASPELIRVAYADVQNGKANQTVVLRDGDTIFVPKAEPFFVTGHVRNPGSYPLERGMTVLQALSVAGGVSDRGSDKRIKIVRMVQGKKIEVAAKLTDPVQPGDTIVVPQRFF
jgi:polysaccharide export outer membrane protein